ncbi:carboxylesterase/lipase family protein [Nocardia brasiliensis]|uniref:carboxylesterase/lipase family protein n=1 Tax=Nocardia brasiliensis TaxID=37326 RepID=UPI002456DB3D|nr:carboxylesterase family protein [Nocardia brasiliensis]
MNVGERVEVRTVSGVVRGEWVRDVAVFRGVPYARPPVGARRFAAPVPVLPWDGVRDALEFGPPVPQKGWAGADSGDCLTLNVWSPDLGAARLPVLVWIHGGAYLEGESSNPHHDGALLAAAGAVVVSMNYRTGVEGFAHIIGAPANRGLLDQAAALRWVRDNVAAFGGDPGRVTVFGQSAGAGSVAALLVMPSAAGLFQRAIAQSVPGTYFAPGLAAAISASIAAEVGAGADIDELSTISPRALIDATGTVIAKMPDEVESWGPMALTPTPFSPVVDGDVLPCAPWQALADGAARGVDVLVGHTRDEFRLFDPHRGGTVPDAELTATLHRLAPGIDYRTAYPDATNAELYETVNADWLFRMPSLHLAAAQRAGCGRAWLYELCWSFNRDEGASHSLDVLLVFGTLGANEVREHPAAHPNAAAEVFGVGHAMRTDWLSFATNGDPGWPPYDPRTRLTRVYTATPGTRPYPEESSCRLWSAHRFAPLNLLGE